MKKFALIALAAIALTATAIPVTVTPGQADSVKEQKIRALIQESGARQISSQLIDLMLPQILGIARGAHPQVPVEFWNEFEAESRKIFTEAMPLFFESMIPIYDRAYLEEEIDQVLAFLRSPAGRKMVEAQPQLAAEGFRVGQVWGEQVARQALQNIDRRVRELGL